MPLRDESKYFVKVDNEPPEVTEIREKILNTFNELVFIDEGHKYYLHDEELMSVSVFASQFEEEFNSIQKAIDYAEKHGNTPEYWLDQWKFTNLKATMSGTQVHAYGEGLAWLKLGCPDNIPNDKKYQYIVNKNWLVPTRPKEESALNFWNEFPENLWVVLPETKVYTSAGNIKYKTNFAGTFDLLCYYKHPKDDSKSGLIVLDYKTNGEIYKEYSRKNNKMLYYPFDELYQEPFGVYTIQLNCYSTCLEDIGLKVIGKRLIWLKDDGTYELIPIDNKTDKIRNIIIKK